MAHGKQARDGGDDGLACVDTRFGTVLARWVGMQGPVAAMAGVAYAVSAAGEVVCLDPSEGA